MDYTRFFNNISTARKASPIRQLYQILVNSSPDLVYLVGGLPNPKTFPFVEASFTTTDGSVIHLNGGDFTDAFQYGQSQGYEPLIQQMKDIQTALHKPPNWSNTDLIITNGAQDGLCKAIEMIVQTKDTVIVPEPTYAGALSIFNAYEVKYIGVVEDANGIIPKKLREALEAKWKPEDANDPESDIPKIIYLNPTGANPTGVTISLERRVEIYKIAREYNLIILEDDPYYFLHFDKERIPSFLSMDVDGRVIRFDSFSKIISPGIRVGYMTGSRQLLERIVFHVQSSVQTAPLLSQVLVSQLLKQWGEKGFFDHVQNVCHFYLKQRNAMVQMAEKHLTGLAEWNVPLGGMFLWIKCLGVKDTHSMIMERALSKNVVLLPGNTCMTDLKEPCPYMRAAFSLASAEEMDRGFRCLAELISEEREQCSGSQ